MIENKFTFMSSSDFVELWISLVDKKNVVWIRSTKQNNIFLSIMRTFVIALRYF